MTARKANPIKPQDIATPWRGKSPATASHTARGGSNGRSAAAPVRIAKVDPDLVEVVVPAHVRVQVGPCYTHDPRYQCGPGERPNGANFVRTGIGRDVRTRKAWGKA